MGKGSHIVRKIQDFRSFLGAWERGKSTTTTEKDIDQKKTNPKRKASGSWQKAENMWRRQKGALFPPVPGERGPNLEINNGEKGSVAQWRRGRGRGTVKKEMPPESNHQ